MEFSQYRSTFEQIIAFSLLYLLNRLCVGNRSTSLFLMVEGKANPITGHEGPWRMWIGVHMYKAKVLGRGRVVSPTLGHLYPRGTFPVLIL